MSLKFLISFEKGRGIVAKLAGINQGLPAEVGGIVLIRSWGLEEPLVVPGPRVVAAAYTPPPPTNFTGLVLGCIGAKFWKQICV